MLPSKTGHTPPGVRLEHGSKSFSPCWASIASPARQRSTAADARRRWDLIRLDKAGDHLAGLGSLTWAPDKIRNLQGKLYRLTKTVMCRGVVARHQQTAAGRRVSCGGARRKARCRKSARPV
jgi:hypothetical protein